MYETMEEKIIELQEEEIVEESKEVVETPFDTSNQINDDVLQEVENKEMGSSNEEKKLLTIIIPCYNEALGIRNLNTQMRPIFTKLQETWDLEVLFIDDGSSDNTNELLHKIFDDLLYVQIIQHEVNKNLGAAMRTGFSHAKGDVVVTMDSDCTYDPPEIFNLLDLVEKGADIVTASPYHPKGGVENIPEYRLFLSRSISWIYQMITGAKIYTFTALFRAHRREVIKNIHFSSNNFLATAQLLIYAIMKGYKVEELPTILRVRKYGVSKMRLFIVIKSHFKFVVKLIWMRMRGKK